MTLSVALVGNGDGLPEARGDAKSIGGDGDDFVIVLVYPVLASRSYDEGQRGKREEGRRGILAVVLSVRPGRTALGVICGVFWFLK